MIKRSDLRLRLIVIGILCAICAIMLFPLNKKINLGLDLRGGMYILLKADLSGISRDKISDAISGAIEKIRGRIDAYGVKETSIQLQGENAILVQVPGVVNRDIINTLKEVGKLEFKIVEDDPAKLGEAIKGTIPQGYELVEMKSAPLLVKKQAELSGADLAESQTGFDQYGAPNVHLKFTTNGAKAFAKTTEENTGKQLAILLDNKVMSAPVIREPILTGQAEISGSFTMDEVRILVSVLNSGALPIPLSVEEERTVGPLLGSDSIKHGINSTLLAILVVALFMIGYYMIAGTVAVIGMVLDVLFILAGLVMLHGTLSLPGIAGMILTLGMAVDANVLIYERIREELDLKKPLMAAVKDGFERCKSVIYDTHFTTIIAAVFLFIFGTGPIRGFATTLILGNIVSLFSSIFVGKTLFAVMLEKGLKKINMLRILRAPKFDFVKYCNAALIFSLIVAIAGGFFFYKRKDTILGTDFKGGQVLQYKITPAADIEEVRKILKAGGFDQLIIQDFKDVAGGIMITSKNDIADKSEELLKKNFKTVDRLTVTTVGPTIGKALKHKATMAVIFSLLGILIYVAFRFKHFDFGAAGVFALFHDIIIALGFVAYFGYEIDLLTITALLTITGYSIEDTIVTYDRVRELAPKMQKFSLKEIINRAINETLARTIITTSTVIMATLAMFLMGGEALKGFTFVLLVGFFSGVYSTIFIASPLVLYFRKHNI